MRGHSRAQPLPGQGREGRRTRNWRSHPWGRTRLPEILSREQGGIESSRSAPAGAGGKASRDQFGENTEASGREPSRQAGGRRGPAPKKRGEGPDPGWYLLRKVLPSRQLRVIERQGLVN